MGELAYSSVSIRKACEGEAAISEGGRWVCAAAGFRCGREQEVEGGMWEWQQVVITLINT